MKNTIKLSYSILKTNRYYLVVIKNHRNIYETQYVINIKPETIEKTINSIEGYKVITIVNITWQEYIVNNMDLDDIEIIDNDYFDVVFYQGNIFKIDGLFCFDTTFNIGFINYNLKSSEIIEIISLIDKLGFNIKDYFTKSDWKKAKQFFE